MTLIISSVLAFLLAYKYLALFVISFISAFLIPLPDNLSILTAASFASQGIFNIYLIVGVALLGNVAGDLAMYGLAFFYGRPVLEKIPFFRKVFTSPKYNYYNKKVETYAPVTILMSRFVTELGPLVNIISGVLPVPFTRFLKFDLIGEFLDVFVFALAGYFLGVEGQSVTQTAIWLVLTVVSTYITIGIVRQVIKVREKKRLNNKQ